MANGRTATKTKTSTATTTAVALGTVGFAVAAAAALAFNYNDLRTATGGRATATVAPAAPVRPFIAGSCRNNLTLSSDLSFRDIIVTRQSGGTVRGAAQLAVQNLGARNSGPFTVRCLQRDPFGNLSEVAPVNMEGLQANRQASSPVIEYNANTERLECMVDSTDAVSESNECNNLSGWSVGAVI